MRKFNETRNKTLQLVKNLETDDYVVQTDYFMSPPKWHLGHVSWIFEAIMSKIDSNCEFYSKELSEYLNSYYQQFGIPHEKGKRGTVSRPSVNQIFLYYDTITKKVTKFVQNTPITDESERLVIMGIHHECQHQELLAYDLQRLLADKYVPVIKKQSPSAAKIDPYSIKVDGGLFVMGYNGNKFCYDIELPEHKVYLDDFQIDAFPVTNEQYLEFINDGGYKSYKFWLSDGWEKVQKNNWEAPMYWEKVDGKWMKKDLAGFGEINPREPVCHVSFYEASAYCKWAGKRLPTEAEWEKAACWNEKTHEKTIFPWGNQEPTEKHANLLESYIWRPSEIGTYPEGKSHLGCYQMIGDVWEWTSSEFVGYPGFKTGFEEYNDKWFTNQKVLRGGSFGTPMMSVRGSYRNFFRLDERWLFSGFRCVSDL